MVLKFKISFLVREDLIVLCAITMYIQSLMLVIFLKIKSNQITQTFIHSEHKTWLKDKYISK